MNQISCFKKNCGLCCVNTHKEILKNWLKFVLPVLNTEFFFYGAVFIGAPYTSL